MKQWLTLPGSICIERSRLFPFSCSTFSKSSSCFEQALRQRHQCHCQCIRVHHDVFPARMLSMENNTHISLFVTDQYLRTGSLITMYPRLVARLHGLRLSHPDAECASKRFSFALWHKEFDDFSLFVLALSSSFNDFTV